VRSSTRKYTCKKWRDASIVGVEMGHGGVEYFEDNATRSVVRSERSTAVNK
jgi:hypothetical protein